LDRDVARPSSHPRPETPHHGRSAACGGWPSQRASGHYAARRSLVPRQVAVAARDAPSPGWGSSPAPAACLGRACSSRFSAAPGKRPPGSSRDPPPRLGGRQRPGALRARLDLGRPPAPHGALRSRLDLRPRGDGTRTGRPGADVRNHHANPDVNPGSSATRWFLPRPAEPWGPAGRPYASVSIPAAHEEAHAGTGRMTLDQSCDPDPGCAGWPMVGRAGAEMISGREGSTKGRTRIFVGLINSQPSGHATLGQGAERRPRARIMAPPTSGLAGQVPGRGVIGRRPRA
jgi:hypothetical protein